MVYNKKNPHFLSPRKFVQSGNGIRTVDRISCKRASSWQADCEGVAGTCLEAMFGIVSSLFSLGLEQFSKDAFIHTLTN